jgi:hypothetical protein
MADLSPAPDAPLGATHPDPASLELTPEQRGRMLLYRLVPVWVFLLTLAFTLIWEFGVRQNPASPEKMQAIFLLSMLVTLLIGAPIGIRWFNPLPAKK